MKTISKGKVTKIALLSALLVLLSVCVSIFAYQITPVKAEAAENTEEPQITLVGANVSLKDSVNIVYAAAVKGYDYTKYKTKLIVWKTPQKDYTIENALKIIEQNKNKTDKSKIECVIVDSSYHATLGSYSCDMFYYGMPAKNIVDQLYVRAYVEIDGKEYYSGTTKYSLLEYLYDQLAKSGLTEYQKRMYEAVLKYGGRAQDLFDYLRNRRADDTFYSIHVENGTFADGFTRGMFLEGEKVVMKANAASEGKKFAYWQDMNGIILGYDEVLTVKATSANTYTAVFVNKITVAEQLHLKASVAYDDDISAVNLPDIIEIKDDAGKTTSSIKVTWDKTQFVKGQIGEQVLTATPADAESKALLGNNTVTMTVTVMPYTFEVDTVTGNYHITKYCGSEAKVSIPEEYRGKPVDTINALAFNAVLSMTELYIPDTVTKIEKNAFNACNNIETIRIPFIGDSLSTKNIFGYIFGTDSYEMQKSFVPMNLHKVIISDHVTNISSRAFYGCKQILECQLPSNLTVIGDYYVFAQTGIKSLSLPISLKSIGTRTFEGTDLQRIDISGMNSFLQINSGSTFGGNAELYLNGKLVTEARFPDGIKEIGSILAGISSLKKVIIPDSATNMRSNAGAFENCKNLEEVVFEGTPQIKEMWGTFTGCLSLKSVHIPASVTKFVNQPFVGCNLEAVYYDGAFEDWCKIDFEDAGQSPMSYTERFYYKKENGYEELINAVIPETITQINAGVLSGYKALRSVTLHEGVTAIAKYAFSGCVNLSSIVLPSQLKFIGEQAFYGCKSLYSINIPKYISEIGDRAFEYCYNLAEVYNCSDYIKDMTIGSDSYGSVAKYAKVIHTDMSEASNIVRDGDYAMFKDGDECIVLRYFGDETSLVLPEIATSINAYAFYENQKITSVTLGSNITAIGKDAFNYCCNLIEVVNKSELDIQVGNTKYGYVGYYAQKVLTGGEERGELFNVGDYSFYKQGGEYVLYRYNGSDKELILPGFIDDGHTYIIGRNVFANMADLTKVEIPDSVTEIRYHAFGGCDGISSITIPSSVKSMETGAIVCRNLVEVINLSSLDIKVGDWGNGSVAYYAQKVLTIEDEKGEVFDVGDYSFYKQGGEYILYRYRGSDKKLILPGLVDGGHTYIIGREVFENCRVDEVVISDSVTDIGYRAFWCSYEIANITIGKNIKTIGEETFYQCKFKKVYYTGNMKSWCEIDFNDYASNPANYTEKFYIDGVEVGGNINLPDGLTKIKKYTFGKFASLTSITIPSSVIEIEEYAFSYSNLTSIVMSENVTSIGLRAFEYCKNLVSIVIPKSVKTIGEYAFYDCSKLTSVEFKNPEGWKCGSTAILADDLRNPETAATYLATMHYNYTWTRG